MKKQLFILGILSSIMLTSMAQKWEKIAPAMEANLSQIKFIDDTTAFVIGGDGYLAKSTDGGNSWKRKAIPTQWAIKSIDFVDGYVGYCTDQYNYYRTTDRGEHWTKLSGVGNGPICFIGNTGFQASRIIARSLDAGQTWTTVPFSNPNSGYIHGISFANKDTGFVVGDYGIMAVTKNNGVAWKNLNSFSSYLYSVFATSGKTAYAVGLGGVILKYLSDGTKDTVLQMNNPKMLSLYAVYFTGNTTGYAVGESGCILKTTDEGQTWVPQISGVTSRLNTVVFLDDMVGFAAGVNGTIIKTTNGGKDWVRVTEYIAGLRSVHMIDSSTVVAVGSSGTILKTNDHGDTWEKQTSGTTLNLNAVFFTSPATGYIAGDSGLILSTVDSGKIWIKNTPDYSVPFYAIHFINKTKGFIVSGQPGSKDTANIPPSLILKTEDSGATWSIVHSQKWQSLKDVFFVTADSGFAVGYSYSSPRIYRTTDGGNTWMLSMNGAETFAPLNSVQFINSQRGFAGGEYGWYLETKDGGTTWTRNTSLGSAGASGDPIYDMRWFSDKKGYGAFLSHIWETVDGGSTWKKVTSIDAAFRYASISMLDSKNGFAVGNNGYIARYYDTTAVTPLPGKTWPGDTDHDRQVTNDDLLPVGLFYGSNGYHRAQVSNSWMGFDSENWKVSQPNGEDIKHIDCNGDGTINLDDTLAIHLNFNKTHARPAASYKNTAFTDLGFQKDKQVYGPGEWVNIQLITKSVLDLYGFAFDVDYDAALVEPGTEQLIYANSWLNYPAGSSDKMLFFEKIVAPDARMYGAITRTTKVNAKNTGEIATLRFQVRKNISVLSKMELSYTHVKANDASGNDILFNRLVDSIQIDPTITNIASTDNVSDFTIYPNPGNGYATVMYELKDKSPVNLELFDALGRRLLTIISELQPSGKYQYTIGTKENLAEGIYSVKLTAGKNVWMKKMVVLQ